MIKQLIMRSENYAAQSALNNHSLHH